MTKPITYLSKCRLSKEKKQEIRENGEFTYWGSAEGYLYKNTFYITKGKVVQDTFQGNGRHEASKQYRSQQGFTFNRG